MFIHSIHGTITQETNFDVFFEEIFKAIKNKYEDLGNQMKGSRFIFKFVSKLV